jgi:hypothetical protein
MDNAHRYGIVRFQRNEKHLPTCPERARYHRTRQRLVKYGMNKLISPDGALYHNIGQRPMKFEMKINKMTTSPVRA